MLPLILFIGLVIVVLVLIEIRERQKRSQTTNDQSPITNDQSPITNPDARPEGCCGEHLVCERETLLQTNAQIVYYDDEELDSLAGIEPETYTEAQHEAIRAVFTTLQESDVPGWCRSLQLRNIALPPDIREEALLIVRERRKQ